MMSLLRRTGVAAAAFALIVLGGCSSERSSAPAAVAGPVASHDLLGGLVGGAVGTVTNTLKLTSVNGLVRTTPLAADITVSRTIGAAGGVLDIPDAGVSVVVPYGALTQPTLITMTARAGSLVAYDFAPHGVTFDRPLVFTQRLKGTNATLLNYSQLRLGYYPDASLLGTTTALVSELLDGVSSLFTWTFTAPIRHFSGYLVLCGRQDAE